MHYRWLSVFSVLSAVLLSGLATPAAPLWGDIRVKHKWNAVPDNWESLGPPPASITINLHIALTPHRENALVDALYEVSNPRHKKYGAYLNKEQVAELVAPHQDTLDIVHSWLKHHGVPSSSISTSHGGGWLTISGVPVSQADELLCASYQLYRHTEANETEVILRTVGYSLPAALHAHVQAVAPTTHFASPRMLPQTPRKRSSEEREVMVNAMSEDALSPRQGFMIKPSYLRWLYNTEAYVPTAMGQNVLGILGFQTGSPSRPDLRRFMINYRVDATAATFAIVGVNGGTYDATRPGVDENILTQYAAAVAYPTPQIYYTTGGSFLWDHNNVPAPGDAYLGWFYYILYEPTIPPTIIISSTDAEKLFPEEYAKVLCNLFAHLGLRGVTVLVTSGDDGVGDGDCKDGDDDVHFIPMFPASCPWVTSVGGTMLPEPEFGATFSGGGFSNYFPRPEYQFNVVPPFLEFLGIEYPGLYNPDGRGIPDVAALADRFAYIRYNVRWVTSSTTCSTAIVAGMVSLLNDYRLSRGMRTLGFLNPLLYSPDHEGVNDITSGSNPGCETAGFYATVGWDPVTGVGTPDFTILIHFLASLSVTSQTSPTATETSLETTSTLPPNIM